jgi:hypothetical protein
LTTITVFPCFMPTSTVLAAVSLDVLERREGGRKEGKNEGEGVG